MPDLLAAWSRAWAWLAGRRAPDPSSLDAIAPTYDAVFAALSPTELSTDDSEDFDLALFRVDRREDRFLGTYTQEGGRIAFERYGFFDLLRARGYDPVLVGDLTDQQLHRMRIFDGPAAEGRLLIELSIGVTHLTLPDGAPCRFLLVNWLLMQRPGAAFAGGRQPLPDQAHPGLGLFVRFAYLLKLMADRVGCDGLVNHPAHPHNGVLYGKVCHFVDPVIEARFRALTRDLGTHDLAWLTREVEAGRVVDADGVPFEWQPAAQVMPVSEVPRAWFESATYLAAVEAELARLALRHTPG